LSILGNISDVAQQKQKLSERPPWKVQGLDVCVWSRPGVQ